MISNIRYVGSAVQPRSQVLFPTCPWERGCPQLCCNRDDILHYCRAATVREKSGKKENFSRSGKSPKKQGKSLILSKSVKSQGILFSGL